MINGLTNPEMAGKRTKCPGCATILTIPAAEAAASAPKPAAPPAAAPATTPAGGVVSCECGTKIRTKPEWAGKTIKCPKCESRIKVPAAAAPAPTPPPAAPKPAPRKPAAPPPPVDDNPFGEAGDSGFGGIGDDPFAGGEIPSNSPYTGAESFGDEENFDEEAPVSKPARRAAPPAKKKGGGRALIYTLLFLLVAGGGGFAAWAFYFNAAPTVIPGRPIAQGKNDDKDDDEKDPKAPAKVDAKEKQPAVDPVPEEKDPKDVPKAPEAAQSIFDAVPGDSIAFMSIKPKALFQTTVGKKLLDDLQNGPAAKQYEMAVEVLGVKITDLEHVLVVLPEAPMAEAPMAEAPPAGVFILTTTKEVNNQAFKKAADNGALEVKKLPDTQTYYFLPKKGMELGLMQIAPNIIVAGKEPEFIKFMAALADGPKEGPLTPVLKAAAGGTNLAVVGFQMPNEVREKFFDGAPPPILKISEAKTGLITVTAAKTVKLLVKLDFEDAEKAEQAKAGAEEMLGKVVFDDIREMAPKEFAKAIDLGQEAFKSIVPTVKGNSLIIPLDTNTSLEKLGEMALGLVIQGQNDAKKMAPLDNALTIATGMLNYHQNYKKFPDAKTKDGLSWRVSLLPYIEQDDLYKKFKLDEPWDSEHNKMLLEEMPKVYEHPDRPAPPGYTYFRVFVGSEGSTIFDTDGRAKVTLKQFPDRADKTLSFVEAETAVPWTKFDELVFASDAPLPKLGVNGQFLASMVIGRVMWFRNLPPDVLKALITTNGGETVEFNTYVQRPDGPSEGGLPNQNGKTEVLDKKTVSEPLFDKFGKAVSKDPIPEIDRIEIPDPQKKKEELKLPTLRDDKKSSQFEVRARPELTAILEAVPEQIRVLPARVD
ncbi:MAG: DUF1559 domain-containing protein [Planctomycetota bacterium]